MVPALFPCENPYDDRGHGVPASAYRGEMNGVGLETSWDRWEAEEVDEGRTMMRWGTAAKVWAGIHWIVIP